MIIDFETLNIIKSRNLLDESSLNIMSKYVSLILKENKNYLAGLNIYKGLVTFKGVADAFSLKYTPASKALSD